MTIQDKTIFAMWSENEPVAVVKDQEIIVFETKDCFNNQLLGEDAVLDELDWNAINPATGPVYIEGAMPGDILKVSILDIQTGPVGTMAAIPNDGVLGKDITKSVLKKIPVKDGIAEFSPEIRIPCKPMIGVIGVAPKDGAVPCGEPGSHGGNMDNTRIAAGATLYLPVFHEGALLAMGDVHACMGDGEIMVTGVEIPARITVKAEVLKGISISDPMLEDEESCYTISSDQALEKAIYIAVSDMTQIVMKKLDMSLEEAGMLLSAMGNLQICQVVDPKRTVRMEMKKTVLKDLGF